MPRSLLRKHFFLAGAVAVLLFVLVAGGLKLAFKGEEGPGGGQAKAAGPGGGRPRGAPVSAYVATTRPFSDPIQVLGVAKGRQSVTLTAPTTELVTRVRFRDGDYVRAGAVLVELQANEQGADVAAAAASVAQAQSNYERWRVLGEKGIAAPAAIDQYRAALRTAEASLAAARARQGDRTIRAPFSGVVGLTDITPGALISPGTPIVTLDDLSVVRVDFEVPDRYLPLLREGQPLVAHSDAYPDEPVNGRIAKLDTRIDERTRAITARAEFPNPGGKLKPGMMMRVAIEQGGRVSVAAPEAAVQFEGDNAFVFAIVPRGPGSAVEKRQVETGSSQGGFIELKSGVNAGDRLVADGLNRIQDGAPVMVAQAGGAGAGGTGAR